MSRLCLTLLCTALWLPAAAFSQAGQPASSAPLKLAWINLEQAIVTCEEGKRELTDVQKFVDGKNQELEKLRKEVESLQTQLSTQADKLTEEATVDLQDQFTVKSTTLQRFQEDTQKQIDNLRTRVTNYIGRRMMPVIDKISQEKKLGAVLYLNAARDAYVDPSLIITEEVIKAYNQAYPLSTPVKKP